MYNANFNLRRDESGQTALETAIILIAFIVVASVFAFTILSAGTASTERGEEAIYSGLEGVQSSMAIRGTVIGQGSSGNLDTVVFTVAMVAGGDPVDFTAAPDNTVIIGYFDAGQFVNEVPWTVAWVGGNDGDALLEEGEVAELTVDLAGLGTPLAANTEFTIEVKPENGAVFSIHRTTPATIEDVMNLR